MQAARLRSCSGENQVRHGGENIQGDHIHIQISGSWNQPGLCNLDDGRPGMLGRFLPNTYKSIIFAYTHGQISDG